MAKYNMALEERQTRGGSVPSQILPPSSSIVAPTGSSAATESIIPAPSSTSAASLTFASPLTTMASYTTTTFTSGTGTYQEVSSSLIIVTDSAQLAALETAAFVHTGVSSSSTTTANASTAAATSTSSSHKSSGPSLSTLIPAIVVPVVVVALLAFGAFWFAMRRRHLRAMEEEAKFEKAKPADSTGALSPDNSSSRNLIPAGFTDTDTHTGPTAPEKDQSSFLSVTPPPNYRAESPSQLQQPLRPLYPGDSRIPPNAIGIARSTSSASPAPVNGRAGPPRSAHDNRSPRPAPRLDIRSSALSSTDIIDSYGSSSPEPSNLRPRTSPNTGAKGLPAHPLMRHPSNSNRGLSSPNNLPSPRNFNSPLPPYGSSPIAASPASPSSLYSPQFHSAPSPTLPPPPVLTPSQQQNSPFLAQSPARYPLPIVASARARSNTNHSLTAENLRNAGLGIRGDNNNSAAAGAAAADNASVSDIDTRSPIVRDDVSDVSSMDEEQERMASRTGFHSGDHRGGSGLR